MTEIRYISLDGAPLRAKSSLEIEGVSVDAIFDDIYRQVSGISHRVGVKLRFEVIAWEPLVVAADRVALHNALREVITHCVSAAQRGAVTVRAFPSHDDVCATFEILDDRPDDVNAPVPGAWEDSLAGCRELAERMGGEMAVLRRSQGGARIVFWLPQWIPCATAAEGPWLCAA